MDLCPTNTATDIQTELQFCREREGEGGGERNKGREGERDRERQRQTDRHRPRPTDRHRQRETGRQRDKERQTETKTDRQRDNRQRVKRWYKVESQYEVIIPSQPRDRNEVKYYTHVRKNETNRAQTRRKERKKG